MFAAAALDELIAVDFVIRGNQSVRFFSVFFFHGFYDLPTIGPSDKRVAVSFSRRHGSAPLSARVARGEGAGGRMRGERSGTRKVRMMEQKARLSIIPRLFAPCPLVPRTINSSTAVLSARSNSTSELEAQPERARRANTRAHVDGSSLELASRPRDPTTS